MTIIVPVAISPPPLPQPDPGDRATFSERKLSEMEWSRTTMIPGMKALADVSYANALDAQVSATSASVSAASAATNAGLAAGYAGATAWVSGAAYAVGDKRYSLIDGRVYRRLTAGSGATDPSADAANWKIDNNAPLLLVIVAGAAQAVVAGYHYAFTNAAATTATAPAAAAAGDRFAASTCNGLTTNAINWNGLNHEGIADATMKLDDKKYHEFVYISAAFGWKVTV